MIKAHIQSKTNGALLLLLGVIVGLATIGKLTMEAVEAIKWVGGSFFLVRSAANLPISRKDTPTPPESK